MKKIAFLVFVLSIPSYAGVIMVPEITPDPVITLVAGETMGIDFVIDSPELFSGLVEWVGVGWLSEPEYPGSPPIIIPPDPGTFPDNMWPIFCDPILQPIPPGVFAWTTYFADEEGNATINLYDLDSFLLIDSFDIVVIPEPMTFALLALGALFVRRR